MALICTSVLALIGFAVYDVLGINKAYYEAGYVWQRYLLSVASLVDVPIVQTLLIGIGLVFFRRSPDADSNVSQDVTTKVVAAGGE